MSIAQQQARGQASTREARGRSTDGGAARARLATVARSVQHWSREHIVALIITAVVAALLVAGVRRWGDAWARPSGRGLAVVILAGFVGEQLTHALRGQWAAQVNLPLQLTDAVTLVSVAALVRSRRCWSSLCISGRSARRCKPCSRPISRSRPGTSCSSATSPPTRRNSRRVPARLRCAPPATPRRGAASLRVHARVRDARRGREPDHRR
jgi:TMEM164 family